LADLDSEFAFLAAAVRRSVDLLRAHPHGTAIRDAERGSALAGHIEHTLAGIDAKLDDALRNFNDATDTEKTEYIKRVRLLNSYARFMHKAVPWISAAARPPLTLGALYFIDELGQRICGSKPDAIERQWTESAFVAPSCQEYEAERREQTLVLAFRDHLEAQGHEVSRLKIVPRGEAKPLFCDLIDRTTNTLYEAKGTVERGAIRMAIGQFMDYARFLSPQPRRAVLLPAQPRQDLLDLLDDVGVEVVWRDAPTFRGVEPS
jgi:hypothetical protein